EMLAQTIAHFRIGTLHDKQVVRMQRLSVIVGQRQRQAGEALAIAGGMRSPALSLRINVRQLHAQEGCLQRVQATVESRLFMATPLAGAVVAQTPQARGGLTVIGYH